MLRNDMVGIEESVALGDPFNGKPRAGQEGRTIGQFVSDPFSDMSSQSLQEYAHAYLKEFHYMTVLMEANAKAGADKDFWSYADVLAERLGQYARHPAVFGDGVLRKNRLRFEYSIARIVNDRSGTSVSLSADDVRRMLPKVVGEITRQPPDWLRKQETFRNMLLVAAEIERFRKSRHRLPVSIEELDGVERDERVDAWDKSILYSTTGEEWRLFSAGGGECSEIPPESAVIPEIDATTGICTTEVWFSSDFSEMRRALFKGGILNPGRPRYECVLDGRVIRRR